MRFTSAAGRTLEIWVYPNQIDIHTPASDFVLEHWDSDTPDHAIDHVLAALKQAVE